MSKPKHQANPPDTFGVLPSPPPWPPYPIPQPPAPVPVNWVKPPERVDPYQNTSAQILQDRNATVAKVSLSQHSTYDFGADPDFQFTATGSSKREQGDRFNARTGELISLSRAYLKLSRQLMSAARELVEPEPVPEYAAPEDNFVGVGAYAAEPDDDDADEYPTPDPRVVTAVEAFNGAADALNTAVSFLKTLTD